MSRGGSFESYGHLEKSHGLKNFTDTLIKKILKKTVTMWMKTVFLADSQIFLDLFVLGEVMRLNAHRFGVVALVQEFELFCHFHGSGRQRNALLIGHHGHHNTLGQGFLLKH